MFSFYLLDEEYEVLEVKAAEAGLSKADLLRRLILFGAACERTNFTKAQQRQTLYELNRIGNNINQIAWRANTLNKTDEHTLHNLLGNYEQLLAEFERLVME